MTTKAPPAPAPAQAPAPFVPDQVDGSVPLDQIRPSPLNPRKSFPAESIDRLAASISEQGLLQRLLVRPVGAGDAAPAFDRGKGWVGLDHFELVDGERRYRALLALRDLDRLATDKVNVTVRWLTDAEALTIMLVANDQREDVPPSEQAAGYARLRAELGGDEAVATAVGRSVSAVRNVLRLARLPRWALAAVDSGALSRATAELVARVPGDRSRQAAAACVLLGLRDPGELDGVVDFKKLPEGEWWADEWNKRIQTAEPLSYRDTRDLIANHFQVELKGAPFDRKALDLVEDAGSCEACPKRAGNDPEAKAEGVRADVCLDPDCFRRKAGAHREREIARAAEKGVLDAEITERFAAKLAPKGWCDVATDVWQTELHEDFPIGAKRRDEPLKALLGKLCPQKYIAFAADGSARTLVKTKEARAALVDAGVLKPPARPERKPEKRTALVRKSDPSGIAKTDGPTFGAVVQRAVGIAASVLAEYGEEQFGALTSLDDAEEDGPILEALRMIAGVQAYDALVSGYRTSAERDVLRARFPGIKGTAESHREDEKFIEAVLPLWSAPKLLAFLLQLSATHEMQLDGPNRAAAENLLAWAELDWQQLQDQARRELTGGESAEESVEEKVANAGPPIDDVWETGEPIAALGLSEEQLERGCVVSAWGDGTKKITKPVPVHPVAIGDKLYVCVGALYHLGGTVWHCLPLLAPQDFIARYHLPVTLVPLVIEENRAAGRGDGCYAGVRVSHRGAEYVIGSKSEERVVVSPKTMYTLDGDDRVYLIATGEVCSPQKHAPQSSTKLKKKGSAAK